MIEQLGSDPKKRTHRHCIKPKRQIEKGEVQENSVPSDRGFMFKRQIALIPPF